MSNRSDSKEMAQIARDDADDRADFATRFVVEQSAREVFDAINDVRGWWSREIDGPTDQSGKEFIYRGKDSDLAHYHWSRIEVEELIPDELVGWLVSENHLSFIDDQSEWRGTRIRFGIVARDPGTELRFSHVGLVPAYECFGVCSNAWGFFINQSLRNLIVTGEGQPIGGSSVHLTTQA